MVKTLNQEFSVFLSLANSCLLTLLQEGFKTSPYTHALQPACHLEFDYAHFKCHEDVFQLHEDLKHVCLLFRLSRGVGSVETGEQRCVMLRNRIR